MSEMREKLYTGELYLPNNEEIMKEIVVDWRGERGDKGYSGKCCRGRESVQGDARNWGT